MATISKADITTAFGQWANLDLPIFVFITKAVLASLLSLSACMYFNLSMPQTSVFTVFIVMQPFSGMVFSKSFYRLIGTIIGTIIAIALVGAFAQDRVSFIAVFAIWIGLCAGIGFISRNFMSYGFVLSGYTIALVTMPTIENPLNIFIFATDRLFEVLIGLFCASLISEVFFPQKLSKTLLKSEENKFTLIVNTFADASNIFDIHKAAIHYSRDILGTDALRINSNFETNMKKLDKLYYKRLNSEFMHISTTFFSLKNIIHHNQEKELFIKTLQKIYAPIELLLQNFQKQEMTQKSIHALIFELKTIKNETTHIIENEKNALNLSDFELINDFNAICSLMQRLENELLEYFSTYVFFINNDKQIMHLEKFAQKLTFSAYSDNVLISMMILRGVLALLFMMGFWLITGWQYAVFAVMPAVANTLLLSTAPNPIGATKEFFIGCAIALILTPLYNFYIIPMYVNDLLSFNLFLTPALILIALFMILPGKNLIGFGILLIFINTCAISTHYNTTFVFFADNAIATILGLLVSGSSFILIDFASTLWIEKRVKKALTAQINILIKGKLSLQRVKLESTGFDLIQRYTTLGRLNSASSNKVFSWLLSTLEIGKAIIHIREFSTLFEHEKKPAQIAKILEQIRVFFDAKKYFSKEEQMAQIGQEIEALKNRHCQYATDQKALSQICLEFSMIYSLMKNTELLPVGEEH